MAHDKDISMKNLRPKTAPFLAVMLLLMSGPCAAGPWRAVEQNSYGWQFMTPDERIEHQRRLRSMKTYEQCQAYQAEQHAQLAERARQAGTVLAPKAQSGCDRVRARGQLK